MEGRRGAEGRERREADERTAAGDRSDGPDRPIRRPRPTDLTAVAVRSHGHGRHRPSDPTAAGCRGGRPECKRPRPFNRTAEAVQAVATVRGDSAAVRLGDVPEAVSKADRPLRSP